MVVLLFLLEPILASMESEEGRSGGGGGLQEILTHQVSIPVVLPIVFHVLHTIREMFATSG